MVWTIYSHWVFDKFINDKVEGAVKNKGIYEKVSKDGKPVDKNKGRTYFKNPKKRKIKPITDDEIQLTELPVTFSRKDLEKLAQEKEFIKQDSEIWAKEHENDVDEGEMQYSDEGDEGMDSYEGFEDAMRLEGYDEEIEQEIRKGKDQREEDQGEEDQKKSE